MFWGLAKLTSKQESDAQTVETRLALIRHAVQQLLVQNPQVEFRSRGGVERESVHVQGQVFIEFFKIREVNESLQPTGGCFPLSIKPFAKSTCTCSVIERNRYLN